MKPPVFVRSLTPEERQTLQAGRCSREAFTVRRSQIVLLSAAGQKPSEIAAAIGGCVQTVRNAIREFNARDVDCLQQQSHRTKTSRLIFTPERLGRLRELLHQSPRRYGKATSQWTLLLLAEVAFAEGITSAQVRGRGVANRPTRSIDESAMAACKYLYKLSRRERLQKAGILSGNFWLTS